MEKHPLEQRLIEQLSPLLDGWVHRALGISLPELRDDITSKLTKNPILGLTVASALPYKKAKALFRADYFRKLLLEHYGNVSIVAKIAEVDRRSIHRFANQARLDLARVRAEMLRPSYVKEVEVGRILEEAFKSFEGILHPDKLQSLYSDTSQISREIVESLPHAPLTLKGADREFDRQYFAQLRAQEKTIAAAARRAGLRYETVHRKLKGLGMLARRKRPF